MKTLSFSLQNYDEEIDVSVDIRRDTDFLDEEVVADLLGTFCLHTNLDVDRVAILFRDRFCSNCNFNNSTLDLSDINVSIDL